MGVTAIGIPIPEGEVMDQVVARAANDYERWSEQVARANHCARPVRLAGRVEQIDKATGEVRESFNTESEPDRTLLIACGSRREARCPSCAAIYRGDAYQIVSSGLIGGKGVPESVASHPMLFVTFTAPSFGPVHAHRRNGDTVHPCRPRRSDKCPHGIPLSCWRRHERDDDRVGQPLCPRCFDYEGQVLWNALAPELWRRTPIYTGRALARLADMRQKDFDKSVRLSYVRVAEYQKRGALHFHVVLRLDGRCSDPEHFPTPPEGFTEELLEDAVREAAARVFAPLPGEDLEAAQMVARWGEQLDVRPIRGEGLDFTPARVAAYVAKYSTKSSDDLGLEDLRERLEGKTETEHHLVLLARAARSLGRRVELQELRLADHAHDLGYRGHWSTKSRRYSTTFTVLRRARRDFARRSRCKGRVPLDGWGREEDQQKTKTRSAWRFVGCGYRNTGEAWLALNAAARAREHRRLAREELSMQARSGEKGGQT